MSLGRLFALECHYLHLSSKNSIGATLAPKQKSKMLFALDLFFSPLHHIPVLALSHRRTPRICTIKIKKFVDNHHDNYTLVDQEVRCYNSFCCTDGCCAWYLNFIFVIVMLVVFFLIWKVIEKSWHKYCRDVSDTAIRNESQENMLMMSSTRLHSDVSSRDYGTHTVPPSLFSPVGTDEDPPPSYEEAVALEANNRN